LVVFAGAAVGQKSLSDASLEQLLDTQVTSASKKEEKLNRIAAAVFVIRSEDIRRSGATSVPDLLRMAPGVDVQQLDASVWAISIRGFNSRFSNKVLVTVDGRSVYSPTFSGVYWDHETLPVEEIDRIEVIRGPGATLWGANAVNGVINIFTRSAKGVNGGLISAGGGAQTQSLGVAEYGGAAGSDGAYRVYGRFSDTPNSGRGADDRWAGAHGGFRSDWGLSQRDSLTVEGDVFSNREHALEYSSWLGGSTNALVHQGLNSSGGSLMARWTHTTKGDSRISLQASYDSYRRTEFGMPEKARDIDVEFQQHARWGSRQDIVWGLSYRSSRAGADPGGPISFLPSYETNAWYSMFFQDEIRLTRSLSLTLGERLEYSGHVHGQDEPSLRVTWAPGEGRHTFWAAAADADRQPSRADTAIQWNMRSFQPAPGIVAVVALSGNPQIENEHVNDYELGYRTAISSGLSLDIAAFGSLYNHLSTWEPHPASVVVGSPVRIVSPFEFANLGRATDYGGEVSMSWNPYSRWRLRPSYSYLHATVEREAASQGATTASVATGFPQNLVSVRSMIDLNGKTQFDQSVYYTARLPGGTVPGHMRLDLRLSRRIREGVEVSVTGQNLLRNRTMEFGDLYELVAAPSLRSIYGRVAWTF
jgi:iron complex outermembrane receptor protein